jgi:hypothetical protein
MNHNLRPLSLGELLDRTFQIYGQNLVLFAGISAIPQISLLLLHLATISIGNPASGRGLLARMIVAILEIIASAMVTAATTFAVSDIYLDVPTNIIDCFSRVSEKILASDWCCLLCLEFTAEVFTVSRLRRWYSRI